MRPSGIDPMRFVRDQTRKDRKDKANGCLATFCGPANINVYWYGLFDAQFPVFAYCLY